MYPVSLLLSIILLGGLSMAAWAENPPPSPTAETTSQATLPLTKIVLYASGVGYFQRDGQIDGRSQVALRFKVDNINDLLKSMIVQDFDGGQVSTVTYDSRDPITRTLKSFAIDLTDNAGLGNLLWQMRGEPVEVATPKWFPFHPPTAGTKPPGDQCPTQYRNPPGPRRPGYQP